MAYRLGLMVVAMCTALAGCADSSPEVDGGDLQSTGSGTTGVGGGEGGPTGGSDGPTGGSDGPTGGSDGPTGGNEGSTGSVDEGNSFGMSDDMPLVADIPDLKRGELGVGTWVIIEQVPPTSGRAILGNQEWFYVQDPSAPSHMGLRVELASGAASPAFDHWLDLVGWVRQGQQGWVLQLEVATEGTQHQGLDPLEIDIATLHGSMAVEYDDALVELVAPNLLEVIDLGQVPGTLLVRDNASRDVVVVDLRPFDLEGQQFLPGLRLQRLVGVAEIGLGRPTVLPRTPDDIAIDG